MNLDQETFLRGVTGVGNRLRGPAGFAAVNRVLAVIALLAGSVVALGDAWFVHRFHLDEIFFNRATAQGLVVEKRYVRHGRSSGYQAIVRFQAESGTSITVSDWYGSNPLNFSLGQAVNVFYDPEKPDHAAIVHGWRDYLVLAPLGMAFFMLLGGMQRLFKARSLLRQAQSQAQP